VANYCRDRIHLALAKELNKIEMANPRENPVFDLREKWERAFTNCFQRVEEESKLIGPDTSGTTALVAVATS
jgi:protein phosphatase 2C